MTAANRERKPYSRRKKPIRQIRVEGDVAYVPLTRGLEAVIDAADVDLVSGVNWTVSGCWRTFYVKRGEYIDGGLRTIYMHRVLTGDVKGTQVDHIDCNGLNNRRNNLRLATPSENTRNIRIRRTNTSGYKGVARYKNKWVAYIMLNRKQKHLGYFDTAEAAHAAYVDAAHQLHGKFARAA